MFGKKIKLLTLFGMPINVDLSWIFLAVLVVWSLSSTYSQDYADLSTLTLIAMGIAGALGLFASIIVHEVAHSLVARSQSMPMGGITLFLFGGVAEMRDEAPSARAEFLMAIAGPVTSLVIGGVCLGLQSLLGEDLLGRPVSGVLGFLGSINLVLVVFNLIPAFPLDGGRVLRSILWKWKGNLRWATRISSRIGSGFGLAIIFLGFLGVLGGQAVVGGIWFILIGFFVRSAAQGSYQQLLIRKALEGEDLRRFMTSDPITVPAGISIRDFVEDYVYRYHFKMFPVVDDGELRGCISTKQVKEVPKEAWTGETVGDILQPCSSENTVDVSEDPMRALALMHQTGTSRLMIVDHGALVGILSLKDLVKFISLKIDLENDERSSRTLPFS
jgi:Zn-dependent protease/predicted transcriptional regulator